MQATLNSPRWRRRVAIGLGIAALALAALWLASRIPRTLTVFLIAAFIAFGVNPIVESLARRMPRAIAILIVYAGLLAIVIILTLLVIPALVVQVGVLGSNAPQYIVSAQSWIDDLQSSLRAHLGQSYLPPGYSDLRSLLASKLAFAITGSLSSLTQILVDAFTATFIGVSALVLSAFFVIRGEHVADSLYELLPAERRSTARALGGELAHVFGAFVSGQVALCAITGALIYAVSSFLGFKFALLLGIISGLAYAIPFVGQVIAHVAATLLAAPQGGTMVLLVNLVVFGFGRVSDNLLVPRIMSESVGVSPIVVMFSVFAGGELFGVPGLLLGIPAAALAKVVWRFFKSGALAAPEPQVVEPEAVVTVTLSAPSPRARKPRGA
jgi:predicted PurR-regulated permease PerM